MLPSHGELLSFLFCMIVSTSRGTSLLELSHEHLLKTVTVQGCQTSLMLKIQGVVLFRILGKALFLGGVCHGSSLLTLALRPVVFYSACTHLSCSLIKHCCMSRVFPVPVLLRAVVQILSSRFKQHYFRTF